MVKANPVVKMVMQQRWYLLGGSDSQIAAPVRAHIHRLTFIFSCSN